MERILFITGLVPNDQSVTSLNKNFMNAAADKFQSLLIEGFKENNCEIDIVSAPFIGSYPKYYKKLYYQPSMYNDNIKYVSFNNIWGVRNISRYFALKKLIKKEKLYSNNHVVIYSVHTPFVKLAKWIKKVNKKVKICLIVPDLPEFMNMNKKKTLIYKLGKRFDINIFYKNLKYIDCFSFVSKHQNIFLNKFNKPFVVVESIYNSINVDEIFKFNEKSRKQIVYAGSLNEKFGIKELIEAMKYVDNSAELILCGAGDLKNYVIDQTNKLSNIKYLGVLKRDEVINLLYGADILINPRKNNEEYTKFSFPSKNMEYLSIGKPVVCYKLDGIPDEYDDFFFYPNDESVEALAEIINIVLSFTEEKLEKIKKNSVTFLKSSKTAVKSTKKIIELLNDNVK